MIAVFVRHGERADDLDPEDPPLTAEGERAAREAGAWIANKGLHPSVILRTRTLRTAQTAAALVAGWEAATGARLDAPELSRRGLPSEPSRFAALLSELHLAGRGPCAVLVGHVFTQSMVESDFGGWQFRVPDKNRGAAFLVEVVDTAWTVTAAYPGRPTA